MRLRGSPKTNKANTDGAFPVARRHQQSPSSPSKPGTNRFLSPLKKSLRCASPGFISPRQSKSNDSREDGGDDIPETLSPLLKSPKRSSRQQIIDHAIDNAMSSNTVPASHSPSEVMSPSWKIQQCYDDELAVFSCADGTDVAKHVSSDGLYVTPCPTMSPLKSSGDLPRQHQFTASSITSDYHDDHDEIEGDTHHSYGRETNGLGDALGHEEALHTLIDSYTSDIQSAPKSALHENKLSVLQTESQNLESLPGVDEDDRLVNDTNNDISSLMSRLRRLDEFIKNDEASQQSQALRGLARITVSDKTNTQQRPPSNEDKAEKTRVSPGGFSTASSFSSISSFGIVVAGKKPVSKSKLLLQQPVTPHPFFWRSHPRVTTTSYGRHTGKTTLSPIRRVAPTHESLILNPPILLQETTPASSLVVLSSRNPNMERVSVDANRSSFLDPSAVRRALLADGSSYHEVVSSNREQTQRSSPEPSLTNNRFPQFEEDKLLLRERKVRIQAQIVVDSSRPFFPDVPYREDLDSDDSVAPLSSGNSWVDFSSFSASEANAVYHNI